MKLATLKQQSLYIIILLFQYGVLYPQSGSLNQPRNIYPSAIFQIQKADPDFLKKMNKEITGNHENELAEKFRYLKRRTPDDAVKKVINNSYSPDENTPGNCPPLVLSNFEGNPQTPYFLLPLGYGPSECHIAISNAGKMVSISNCWMNYYKENGTLVFSDSLYHFGNSILDVHVLYDPNADRFVFSSSYGYYNADPFTLIGFGTLIGFSKSNDPLDGWYLYQLPYTDFHDNSVGDYPLLAISDNEVFITLDYYNAGNKYKHVEIIQINKGEGYAGSASLLSQKYDAPLTGNTKGTMVPAQGGSTTYGPKMYFIMANESGNSSNKYYVYEITNTIASGQAVLNRYGPVTSNISYSGSGVSYQPGGIPLLDPNAQINAYVENAFYENGLLQFCQNSHVNGKAGVIIGRINGIPNNLSCTAKTVYDPALYLQFPSIAYAGNSVTDNCAIVGIQHTGENTYPGLSAVYVNSNFDVSGLTIVKSGVDTINGLWGDYSGTCRRYNHPGEVWFEGQYGSAVFPKINWITKLNSPSNCEGQSAIPAHLTEKINPNLIIYPNPVFTSTSISFTLDESQNVLINIFDENGKRIKILVNERFEKGQYELKWDTETIATGTYLLQFVSEDYAGTKTLSVIK